MTITRTVPVVLLGTLLVVTGMLGFVGTGASQATQCQPVEDRQLCIESFSLSDDRIVVTEQGEFSVTVVNEGNVSTTGTVMLHTASPENETDVYQLDAVSLEPGGEQTLTRTINASTPGTHALRVTLSEASSRHVFDVSEIKTIEVLEDHPKELGGPIDRTEIALGALVGAVVGLLLLGYRELNS